MLSHLPEGNVVDTSYIDDNVILKVIGLKEMTVHFIAEITSHCIECRTVLNDLYNFAKSRLIYFFFKTGYWAPKNENELDCLLAVGIDENTTIQYTRTLRYIDIYLDHHLQMTTNAVTAIWTSN